MIHQQINAFAKHVQPFTTTLNHLSVVSNDIIVILNINDLSNIYVVAKYEAVGATSSLVMIDPTIPHVKTYCSHNGLLKYYNIHTMVQSYISYKSML